MKFTAIQKDLMLELGILYSLVGTQKASTTLQNIKLHAENIEDGIVHLTATDMDSTIRTAFYAEVKEAGEMCIQGRKFIESVALLASDAEVSVSSLVTGWAIVTSGKMKLRLSSITPDLFPECPELKIPYHVLPCSVLIDLISRTFFAMTKEEGKYQLSGTKLILEKNTARMVATDGSRLVVVDYSNKNLSFAERLEFIIPSRGLKELKKMAYTGGNISIGTDDHNFYAEISNRTFISRLLVGAYPDYAGVLLSDADRAESFEFDKEELLTSIKRALLVADENSLAIKLGFKANCLEISAISHEFDVVQDSIDISYTGKEFEIGINATFVQEFLSHAKEKIYLEFSEQHNRFQFREDSTSGYNYRTIIMPIRL